MPTPPTHLAQVQLPPPPTEDMVIDATEEEVASFHERGYLAIDRITTDAELDWARNVYDLLFKRRAGVFAGGYFDLNRPYDAAGEDLNPQLLMPELRFPVLRTTVYARNARRISAALLGLDPATLHSWGHMIRKPAHIGGATPWHQDEAYWEAGQHYQAIGAWMPLDPATVDSGCLHFIPGSHIGPVLAHRHIGDDPSVHGLCTDEADTSRAVAVPLHPGGATFHHPRTLHHAGPNVADHPRRAWAVEHQLPPEVIEGGAEKPWVEEGRQAWDDRPVVREALGRT